MPTAAAYLIFAAVLASFALGLLLAIRAPRVSNPRHVAMQAAINVVSMEYRALIGMHYNARQARANVRAYIQRHYGESFNGDERAHILRAAITHAQLIITRDNAARTVDGFARVIN